MKRTISLVMVVLFTFSILLAGCASKDESTQTPVSSVSVSDSPATTAPIATTAPTVTEEKKEPVTLTYSGWGSPGERKATQDAINGFMKKYPWITVKYMNIPDENGSYDTKMTTMLAANQAPDAALFHGSLGLVWAEQGKLLNIMDFLNKDSEITPADILPQAFYCWEKEKCMGMNGAIEAFGLFYNKDMFKDAGVADLPTSADKALTWEQFVEVCQKLTLDTKGRNALDPNFDFKNIKQFGVNFGTWAYNQFVYMNGGSLLSDDGTTFNLNQPEAIEGIQKLSDLMNKYHVMPSPAQQKNIAGAATALLSKKVAIAFDGQWALQDLTIAKVNLGVGIVPKLNKVATMTLGDPLVIFSSTKHPEEAYLLLKWFWNPENTLDLQKSGLWMPILKKWYTDPALLEKWAKGNAAHPEGYIEAIVDNAFANGVPSPDYTVKNVPNINAIIGPALDKVWLGQETAEKALNDIAPKVQPLIKGKYERP
ncbi:sugar ABC transporter substrate-binding protein [Paenibacillus psychroresistens]|uniref:Sugar ABC transporter substrate-binding protein n=1 Tax=Paenibacillus psychroresistens TaxID=1778678 RepID=A0A6B8RHT5_9BACL|nr:sugar ABC transporter substrate-binding protein [Paenibacillus psychroresistens]QGQ95447.1 sugar ABC transporter substrate-binding protein [Paenibacillus psychroresistens]